MEFNEAFDRALGRGPEGPTYVAPRTRRASLVERIRTWAWYRWGWGQRPGPRHVVEERAATDAVGARRGRHTAETPDATGYRLSDLLDEDVA